MSQCIMKGVDKTIATNTPMPGITPVIVPTHIPNITAIRSVVMPTSLDCGATEIFSLDYCIVCKDEHIPLTNNP